jgi:hypothetical protein
LVNTTGTATAGVASETNASPIRARGKILMAIPHLHLNRLLFYADPVPQAKAWGFNGLASGLPVRL